MNGIDRRQFLQSAAWLASTAAAPNLFAADMAPRFADKPTFDPRTLFLTWQRDPTTTMTIQWVGDEKEGLQRPIWYAEDGSEIWRQATATPRKFPLTNQHLFRTELTGLKPGADYRFHVGLDSAEHRFRTMPAKATDTIQFVSGGDSGTGTAAKHTNDRAAAQAPSFVVMGGDIAYENGKDADAVLNFLKNYSKQLVDDKKRHIPLLACIGNHEVDGGYEKSRKEAPFFYSLFDGLFTNTGYASLDIGDYMSLVFLDTNHTSPVAGDQTNWLEKTLREREERPNVFVFNHVPAYPSYRPFKSTKPEDDEKKSGEASRQYWVPLFERYNVDAVFEHHDHAYKRTHPLMDGRVDPKNGLVYLGDGSWGKIRRPETPEKRSYLAVAHEAYHLSVHRIEGDQRFHIALSDSGRIVDVCTTRKRSRMKHAKVNS